MDLRGFTDLGADIGKRVSDSINSGNFNQMNRDIRRMIEDAFTNPVSGRNRDVIDGRLYRDDDSDCVGFDRVYNEPEYVYGTPESETVHVNVHTTVPLGTKLPGKGGAIAMMIVGYFFAVVFGFSALGLAVMMIPAGMYSMEAMTITGASAGLMIPFTAGGLALGIAGTKRFGTAKRLRQYLSVLQSESFCQIKQLAAKTGKSEKYTVRDLSKMIKKGYFPQGHIDDHKTCFIGDNVTYDQYIAARDSAAKAAAVKDEPVQHTSDAIQQVIEEGKAYIKTIQDANDAIYDPVISDKLYRMEIIVKKIFDHVKENPDQVGQLRRFMSYYMPITEKLVRAYWQMDGETVLGKNMTRAKDEIAETLDTINDAYEKLYDSMHIDIVMDVSSDISVLKTMFAQEGLSKDELGGKKDE